MFRIVQQGIRQAKCHREPRQTAKSQRTDTPALRVNHCSQSAAFGALNGEKKTRGTRRKSTWNTQKKQVEHAEKARGTRWDGQAQQQQNSAGTSLQVTEKARGSSLLCWPVPFG